MTLQELRDWAQFGVIIVGWIWAIFSLYRKVDNHETRLDAIEETIKVLAREDVTGEILKNVNDSLGRMATEIESLRGRLYKAIQVVQDLTLKYGMLQQAAEKRRVDKDEADRPFRQQGIPL